MTIDGEANVVCDIDDDDDAAAVDASAPLALADVVAVGNDAADVAVAISDGVADDDATVGVDDVVDDATVDDVVSVVDNPLDEVADEPWIGDRDDSDEAPVGDSSERAVDVSSSSSQNSLALTILCSVARSANDVESIDGESAPASLSCS